MPRSPPSIISRTSSSPSPRPAVLLEHVDVREVRERDAVARRAAEADLPLAVVEADDALPRRSAVLLARTPGAQ